MFTGGCETIQNLNKETYTLTTKVVGPDDNSFDKYLDLEPGKIVLADTGQSPGKEYYENERVKLRAEASDIFEFEKWVIDGNDTRSGEVLDIPMVKNTLIEAKFKFAEKGPYPVTIINDFEERGKVIKTPDKESYESGSNLKIEAKPANGYKFSHWVIPDYEYYEDEFYTDNPFNVKVVDKMKIKPYFYNENAETVTFKDEVIEKEVRKKVERPKGVIFTNEVRDISELIVYSKNLDPDLPDLHLFENLETLDISDIRFDNNSKVEEVDLSSLKDLAELKTLKTSRNGIKDLSPISVLDLKVLYLNETDSEDSDLEDLNSYILAENLEELYLAENKITNISELSNFTSLKTLNLRNNGISTMTNIKDMNNLETLNLSYNSITNVDSSDIENLDNLKVLNLEGNQITNIMSLGNFKGESLREINLRNNSISNFDSLKNIKTLEKIDLRNNVITSIPEIKNINRLDELDLGNNEITSLENLRQMDYIGNLNLENNLLDYNNDRGVLDPIDPNTYDIKIGTINLLNNNLDNPHSQDIIERLEENGTTVKID